MTRHEQRCFNLNNSLFKITDDMPEETRFSRLGIFEQSADENIKNSELNSLREDKKNKYNFREYNQDQSFFIPVTKEK